MLSWHAAIGFDRTLRSSTQRLQPVTNIDVRTGRQHPLTVFELNAAVNPDSWLAHNSLARAYAAKKMTDAARREFVRALEIRPNAPETLSAMDRLP